MCQQNWNVLFRQTCSFFFFFFTIYKKIWETAKKSGKERLLRGSIAASGLLRKVHIDPRRILFKSVFCSAVMGFSAWAAYGLAQRAVHVPGRLGMLLCMFFAMAVAVVVYIICVVATSAVTGEDLELITGGEKIAALLRMK